MWKYLTRRNPWYTFLLIVAQICLAVWDFNRGELWWGGFFMWAAGYNTYCLLHPKEAPDAM